MEEVNTSSGQKPVADTYGSGPGILWQSDVAGINPSSVQQTGDGGYIVAGTTSSSDIWVGKLTSTGTISWQKTLGGTGEDYACDIKLTSDGGYIVAGSTNSTDGDVSGKHSGGSDGWVVKLTSTGDIDWQQCLGGTGSDSVYAIVQTKEGGYMVTGITSSSDIPGYHGGLSDAWVAKLTGNGNIKWQKCYGGTGKKDGSGDVLDDGAYDILQTSDGGFIIAGYSYSSDGDVLENHGEDDIWIVKLTKTGDISWQKSIGGDSSDWANHIRKTRDGGYIVIGTTYSGYHLGGAYLIKLTSTGKISWEHVSSDFWGISGNDIKQTRDGGYIVAAGYGRGWGTLVIKYKSNGEISWLKSMLYDGDMQGVNTNAILQSNDRGYIIAVTTGSDRYGYPGSIIKLAADAPVVSNIKPATAPNSAPVKITNLSGDYFKSNAAVLLTRTGFPNITATNVKITSSTKITCTLPIKGAAAGSWNIVVRNPDGQMGTLVNGFSIVYSGPVVKSISPSSASNIGLVKNTKIMGSNFQANAKVSLTRKGHKSITATNVIVVTPYKITCTLPIKGAATGSWNIVVRNPDGKTSTKGNGFKITAKKSVETGITHSSAVTIGSMGNTNFQRPTLQAHENVLRSQIV